MKEIPVSFIPGDGIGPEVAGAARKIIDAAGAPIVWETVYAGAEQIEKHGTPLPPFVLGSIRRNGFALKGPISTPIGCGFRSVNVALRKELDLFANVRPVKTLASLKCRFDNVDIIVIRENTEDLYVGREAMIDNDTAESYKRFTRAGCERIAHFAFKFALDNNRKRVTAVHKANIMKFTDGMFLSVACEVSKEYPTIVFDDILVDALCMKLVQTPEKFDVLLTPNLYGDIVSDLTAGLVGGLGLAPSANIGRNYAVFEPCHGSAPDIAGKNLANPSAAVLSGVMLLRRLGLREIACNVQNALYSVLTAGEVLTMDLGGSASTQQFTEAVIDNLQQTRLF